MPDNKYINIGCGLCAPESWDNYDASPTLQLQRIPILGWILKRSLKTRFPDNVQYGNVIHGMKGIRPGTVKAVYSSHMLEHLALNELKQALVNVHTMLEKGGVFRMVLPDLQLMAQKYVNEFKGGSSDAANNFMKESLLGEEERPKGLGAMLRFVLGNANHQWMWDELSLSAELKKTGFSAVKSSGFGQSAIKQFTMVEEEGRFRDSFCLEAVK